MLGAAPGAAVTGVPLAQNIKSTVEATMVQE